MSSARWTAAAAAMALTLAACGDGIPTLETGPQDTDPAGHDCIALADLPGGDIDRPPATSALFPWQVDDPPVADGFDPDEIISGGPPPDGILPIDEPCYDHVDTADQWLANQSPVMVVEVGDDSRAYPLSILTQHEIVNDVIDGVPVVVTYCPLCNSGLAFEATVDGQVLDFGTSGRLFRSNLVMYDRQSRTLWSQFTGGAVVGDMVGTDLVRVPTALLDWATYRDNVADGLVLSPATFPQRDYGRNPYVGYEDTGDTFLFRGPRDDALPATTRVVGMGTNVDPVAVPLPELEERRVVDVEVDGQPVTVWWAPGQASAVDRSTVDEGRDVGSTGAFRPVLDDGTRLAFEPADDGQFVDDQTGSTWNLLGEAVDGPLAGTRLESIARDDTFWFVWFAFQPDTRIQVP